jgi:hypothetical protein
LDIRLSTAQGSAGGGGWAAWVVAEAGAAAVSAEVVAEAEDLAVASVVADSAAAAHREAGDVCVSTRQRYCTHE